MMEFLSFLFLTATFISLWIKRDPKIWGSLLTLSVITGFFAGMVNWTGLVILAGILLLWIQKPNVWTFVALVAIGTGYKLKLLPGFPAHFITPKFAIGLINPIIGLLPLALIVPLAKTLDDWKSVLKGVALGCVGIAIIAILAVSSGAIKLNLKMPEHLPLLTYSNLFLTSIPEEGFYRGFIQNTLSSYFGKAIALILSAALFSLTHIYWSPNIGILALTFVTGLLYGGIYLYSKKIESAILCHFLLNFIHMTLFSYHAI